MNINVLKVILPIDSRRKSSKEHKIEFEEKKSFHFISMQTQISYLHFYFYISMFYFFFAQEANWFLGVYVYFSIFVC